jgi:protein translocase SecG subunit
MLIVQIVLSVVLSLLILIQTPVSSLNLSTMGTGIQGGMKKRGPAKFLHIATIVVSVLWIASAIALFLQN